MYRQTYEVLTVTWVKAGGVAFNDADPGGGVNDRYYCSLERTPWQPQKAGSRGVFSRVSVLGVGVKKQGTGKGGVALWPWPEFLL